MVRATFSLEAENVEFIEMVSGDNKSAFINQLVDRAKTRYMEQRILKANAEEAQDLEYQKELSEWDTTLSDGLNNV